MAIRGMLIDTYQYKDANVKVLRDDGKVGYDVPTRANILKMISDVVKISQKMMRYGYIILVTVHL